MLLVQSSVCSDEGLVLEMSAIRQIPQAKNIPFQPLLIKPYYPYSPSQKKIVFFNTYLPDDTNLNELDIGVSARKWQQV